MGVRLNKVLTELNIGLQTAVDYLKNKKSLGEIKDDANVNTKISDEQYAALVKEFSRDKDVKKQANMIFPKKEKKEKPKPKETIKVETKEETRQTFTPLGKIDLDSLSGKKPAAKPAAEPAKETPAPKVAAAEKPRVGDATSGTSPVKEEVKKEEVKVAEVKSEPQVEAKPEPKAEVYLQPEEVSLAIGRGGMNIKLASMLTEYTIDVFRVVSENEADEDIYLDEFADEIDQWVIDSIKAIGLDTAKSVLNAPREMLIEKADLEEETVDHLLEVLRAEFE